MVTRKERILNVLKKTSETLTPKQIHVRTRINHNTIKVYVRQLFKEGLINQPYPGAYSYETHLRVGEPPPRVQNVRLQVRAPWLSRPVETVEESVGDVGISVLFGLKRKRVTGYISRDQGLDYVQMVMAWELFRMYVALNGGPMLDVDEVEIQSCEVLRDYEQLRLDGVKCVTVKSFLGVLERVYNREHGLRSEVKVQPQDVNTIMTLLKGGASSYNILQGQFMIVQEIRRLTEAVKGSNSLTSTLIGLVKELLERRLRDE